jgi:hypothetical protein
VTESLRGRCDLGTLCENLTTEKHEELDCFGVGAGRGLIHHEHAGVYEIFDGVTEDFEGSAL